MTPLIHRLHVEGIFAEMYKPHRLLQEAREEIERLTKIERALQRYGDGEPVRYVLHEDVIKREGIEVRSYNGAVVCGSCGE